MIQTRVVKFHQTGGPEVLRVEQKQLASPAASEVLIQHHAIGINFLDTYYRSGLYHSTLPSELGSEGAGVVVEVGKDVSHFRPRDRVAYGQGPLGAYAEYRLMSVQHLVKLPEGISFEQGAAIMLKGLTVYYLLRETYKVAPGEIVLFHAAAGGVGLLACQWAKALGARLIGTVSTPQKAQLALSHGAWKVINYSHEDVAEQVSVLTEGKKVKVVYDGVGKDTWEISLNCLQPRGLMVSFGNASGPVTGVNLGVLASKGSLYVTRPTLGSYIDSHEKLQLAANELFALVLNGKIQVEIPQKYKLEDVQKAHQDLGQRKNVGSSILIP